MVSLEGTRVVPWADWSEWLELKEMLSNGETERACQRVAMYRLRRRSAVPITILTSVALLKQLEQPDPDPYLQRLALSMTLTRFVNGTTDRLQPRGEGSSAKSVYFLATELQLPLILVEIRHQASHNVLPRLSTLTSGARQALGWLETFYWEPQSRNIAILDTPNLHDLRLVFEKDGTNDMCSPRPESELALNPVSSSKAADLESDILYQMKSLTEELEKEQATSGKGEALSQDEVATWSACGNENAWKVTPLGLVPGQLAFPRSRRRLRRRTDPSIASDGSDEEMEEHNEEDKGEGPDALICVAQTKPNRLGLTAEQEAYVAKKAAEFEQLAATAVEKVKKSTNKEAHDETSL